MSQEELSMAERAAASAEPIFERLKRIKRRFARKYPDALVADCGKYITEGIAGEVQVQEWNDGTNVEVGAVFVKPERVRVLQRFDEERLADLDRQLETLKAKRRRALRAAHRRGLPIDLERLRRIHEERLALEKEARKS